MPPRRPRQKYLPESLTTNTRRQQRTSYNAPNEASSALRFTHNYQQNASQPAERGEHDTRIATPAHQCCVTTARTARMSIHKRQPQSARRPTQPTMPDGSAAGAFRDPPQTPFPPFSSVPVLSLYADGAVLGDP